MDPRPADRTRALLGTEAGHIGRNLRRRQMAKRPTTKTAKLKTMLERPKGASLDALCKATGWCCQTNANQSLSGQS